ncbi:MAG: DUF4412 domain-containing protein [Flavobacteriales bacterium]|nr:DUF4412 domain-containing protein [Flavobacteriales bacterium]
MQYVLLPIALGLALSTATAQEFSCSFALVVSETKSDGDTHIDSMTYHFQGANAAMVMYGRNGQPDVRMVFDNAARTITQLFILNGRKGGFVFPMSEKRWPGMAYSETAPAVDTPVQYTGKTKTLQGHTCREARMTSTRYNATAWIAHDIPLSLLRVFSYHSVGAGKSTAEVELLAQMGMTGLAMEMQLESLTEKPDVTLRVENYRESADPAMFSTEGYSTSFVEE